MTTPDTPLDAEGLRQVLRKVSDPEVGINIVDLGLIYGIDINRDEIRITMTMTSPACPMGDMIMDDIDGVLDAALPPEVKVYVDLVWEPPWSPEMMTPEARKTMGW